MRSADERSPLETTLRQLSVPRTECAAAAPEEGSVRCVACAHRCLIRPGRAGICKVRFNESGELLVPWGYAAGLAVDPIEKKPFFHVHPGEGALSFGMLGCDMHCAYCQNWLSSQVLRDAGATSRILETSPDELVDAAVHHGAPVVVSTYNEPLITAEWSADVFDRAKERGLVTGFVSNGNATEEVLDFLAPRLDLYKVDLKGFDDREYRRLGAVLDNVLAGIEGALARGLWVEVVTLVVPGLNDSDAELSAIARFLAGLSRDIPWHVTAFHPDYKMKDRARTPAASLRRALHAGREAGLRYVYPGNSPELRGEEDTRCPACGTVVIERRGWTVRRLQLDAGACRDCGTPIPGRWPDAAVPIGA